MGVGNYIDGLLFKSKLAMDCALSPATFALLGGKGFR